MNKKLNIARVTHPSVTLTEEQWVKEVNFGKMYVKPYQYFSGNIYNPQPTNTSVFNKIIKFLNKIS
jgi:hypothetical protein